MKKLTTILMLCLAVCGIFSCKLGADEKFRKAMDSTQTVISYWKIHMRDRMYTDEAQKQFTDQFNQLVQYNKTQGVVKKELSDEQIKEVEKLYGQATTLKGKMRAAEMQLDFGRRGANWAGEKIESPSLDIDF